MVFQRHAPLLEHRPAPGKANWSEFRSSSDPRFGNRRESDSDHALDWRSARIQVSSKIDIEQFKFTTTEDHLSVKFQFFFSQTLSCGSARSSKMKTLGRWRLAEAQAGPICNQLLLVLADTDIWAEFEPPKNSKQINNLVYPNSNFRREKSRSSKFLFTASIEVIVRNLRIELISERFHDSISKNNSIYMGAFFRYESPGMVLWG